MTEEDEGNVQSEGRRSSRSGVQALVVVAVVLAVFAGLLIGKGIFASPETRQPTSNGVVSITAQRNDASGDYATALRTGRPIYVLFHSLS